MQNGLIGGFNDRAVGHMRASVHLHIGLGGSEQVSSSGSSYGLYSWGSRFEPWPGDRISWLDFSFSKSSKRRLGTVRVARDATRRCTHGGGDCDWTKRPSVLRLIPQGRYYISSRRVGSAQQRLFLWNIQVFLGGGRQIASCLCSAWVQTQPCLQLPRPASRDEILRLLVILKVHYRLHIC